MVWPVLRRVVVVVGLGLALLTGCAAGSEPAPETPAVTPGPPIAGALCLGALDVDHRPPADVCLPAGTEVTYTFASVKTLILIGPEAEGAAVRDFLEAQLPTLGWTVTGTGVEALRFEWGEWEGSFAIGDGEWGLTARAE
jgi:hypothetical protein